MENYYSLTLMLFNCSALLSDSFSYLLPSKFAGKHENAGPPEKVAADVLQFIDGPCSWMMFDQCYSSG